MTHTARIERLPVGLKRLWFGVLAAPAAWAGMEGVGYWLAARSCEPGTGGVPMEGTARPALTQVLLAVVMLAIALGGLAVAVHNWRAVQPQARRGDPPEWGRAHFMAFGGVLISVLFVGGIVLFGLPTFLVDACRQSH